MTSLTVQAAAIPERLVPTSFTAARGEMIAVIGPNGGGKTSLLRAIAGVEQAKGGVIIGDDSLHSMPEQRRRSVLSFLPASRDIGWPIPVRDVVQMGQTKLDDRLLDDLLEALEIDRLAVRPVDQLSTGERTRVLFARCLAAQPALHLLDEPLSNLDPYWAIRFLDLMQQEAARGAIILASLHDLSHLHRFDRVLLMAEGKLQMDETPAILLDSERFEQIFRIRRGGSNWAISRQADRQSSR